MASIDDELKFEKLRYDLLRLKKIEAPDDFEFNLMDKINQLNTKRKKSLFKIRIFNPYRAISSAAFSMAAVVVILILLFGSNKKIDPYSVAPKVINETEDAVLNGNQNVENANHEGTVYEGSEVNKAGFIYKQIYLTPAEKEKVKLLKEKMVNYYKQNFNSTPANP